MRAFGSARFTGLSSVRVGGIAVSDDEPAPLRTRRPRRAVGRDDDAQPEAAAVAVLDREDEAEPVDEDEPGQESDVEDRPRRRTDPEPGTAAERAAARRARLREQSDGEGQQ
jgi:preprotein translocase subunit SecD